jgi:hypothetical protein
MRFEGRFYAFAGPRADHTLPSPDDALMTVAFEARVLPAFAATRAVTILRITRSGNGLSGVN